MSSDTWSVLKSVTEDDRPRLHVIEYLLQLGEVESRITETLEAGKKRLCLWVRRHDRIRADLAITSGGTLNRETLAALSRQSAEEQARSMASSALEEVASWRASNTKEPQLNISDKEWHVRSFSSTHISLGEMFFSICAVLLILPLGMAVWIGSYSLETATLIWILVIPLGSLAWLGRYVRRKVRSRIFRRRQAFGLNLAQSILSGTYSGGHFALYLREFEVDTTFDVVNEVSSLSTDSRLGIWRPRLFDAIDINFYLEHSTIHAETAVTAALWRHVPVLSLGQPYSLRGSARIPVDDNIWKDVVHKLILAAAFVIIIPSESRSTLWEALHLQRVDALSRTVFLAPIQVGSTPVDRQRWWSQLRSTFAGANMEFPELAENAQLFMLDHQGRLMKKVIVASMSEWSLRSALNELSLPLRQGERSWEKEAPLPPTG